MRGVPAAALPQAFHCFDAPAALVEIHRVLTTGGGLLPYRTHLYCCCAT